MSGDTINKYITLASLVIVLFLGFWLRTTKLEQYPPGISNDEAKNLIDYGYIAQTGRTAFYEDEGRAEPINRLVSTMGSILYGSSVWAFRLTSAFWGILTISATYWTATQCFAETSPQIRRLASLFATITLAIALGHITVTRSLYRAVPQPFFILLVIGFTARGLRTYRWHNFIWVGIFSACVVHTYTSGLIVPLIFIPLGLTLLIFQLKDWKKWIPRLLLSGIILAILTSPVIYLLLTQPSAVLARATDVAESSEIQLERKIVLMIGQFFTEGDENPQYNVANAPLLAQMLIPFFFIGLTSLVIRLRQPSSILIIGLLFLNMIPVLLGDEITHGLRIYSEFAVLPLVFGASIILISQLTERLPHKHLTYRIGFLIILSIGIYQVILSHQTYINFWEDADTEWRRWVVYDRELTHNEWFFRSDRKALTNWIKAQDTPLLIPVEELTKDAQRAMLMSHYPTVETASTTFQPLDGTQVLIPWSLENGDFLDKESHFALLNNGSITLLPPLTAESQQALIANIDSATAIEFDSRSIPVVGKVFSTPDNLSLEYEYPKVSLKPIAIFNDELEIQQWYGQDTISEIGDTIYTIDWAVNRPVSHEYGAFVQLLTQNWERITGQDKPILRWLYPSIAWQPNQLVSDRFKLNIPDNLPSGAYRLVAGAWYVNGGRMPAESFVGETTNNTATIGWIKVPQISQPKIPDNAIKVSVNLNDQFQLTHATIESNDSNKVVVKLFWQSLVSRPEIDATVFVHAVDAGENIVSQSDIRPWDGQYPTFIWDVDEIMMTEHELEVANTDNIQLIAGMYTQPDFVRLSSTQNEVPLPDNLIILGDLEDLLEQ